MIESVLSIMVFLMPLIFEWWKEMEEKEDEETKRMFNEALAAGDGYGISLAFERMREQSQGHSDPGRPHD